jgi:hypothetical protein
MSPTPEMMIDYADVYLGGKIQEYTDIITRNAAKAIHDNPKQVPLDDIAPLMQTPAAIFVPAELLHTTDVYRDALDAVAREYIADHNIIFDADKPNILYILADIIFSNRPMMPADTSDAATKEYIQAYEEINQRLLNAIRNKLNADDVTYAQTIQQMCNVMVIDYANSIDGVRESNNRIKLIDTFRRTVIDELHNNNISVALHGLDDYRPLDDEMRRYGHDTLVGCWVAPLQADNHNLEGAEIAGDVATLHDIIDDDLDPSTAAVSDAMESLIASQGMNLAQWANDISTTPGAFAASLRDEINEMTGLLMQSSFLIAQGFISITDLDAIMRGNANALCIPAAGTQHREIPVGLFDPVTGSGSLIDIELERDWLVPCTARTLNSSFGGTHTDDEHVLSGRYGYAPSEVYGENNRLNQIHAVRLPVK